MHHACDVFPPHCGTPCRPDVQVALQFPDLFDEVAILQRLAYKNNNQHRASKHHQAVCQVRLYACRQPACQQPTLVVEQAHAQGRTPPPCILNGQHHAITD